MISPQSPHENHDFPRAIGNPATSALLLAGYSRLEQLTQVTEADLSRLHGMGPKALGILKQTLEAKGLAFAPNEFSLLAAPAQRALAGAGFTRLEQLTKITESELKQLHGIGPNALKQLRTALEARGWSFAPEK
ncbi:MAG: hypothetical protein Fur0022_37290 [Anaerolineales bacterium]